MENQTIQKLIELGFREIPKENLRKIDYSEVIEYYSKEEGWRDFAKK